MEMMSRGEVLMMMMMMMMKVETTLVLHPPPFESEVIQHYVDHVDVENLDRHQFHSILRSNLFES